MGLLLRAAIWWFGIAMMIAPLVVAVAASPAQIVAVADWSTYLSQYKEVLFIGIAVGGLAVADSSEMAWVSGEQSDWRLTLVIALLLVVFLQVILCAAWYGRAASGQEISLIDAQLAVGLVVAIVVEGFAVRCTLWALANR